MSEKHKEGHCSRKQYPFPKARRLLKRHQFLQIQRKGRKIYTSLFVVCISSRQDSEGLRVGITTSRKVGKAVFRNRIRRLVRDAVRRLWLQDLSSFDIVLIAKNDIPHDITQKEIDESINYIRQRLLSWQS